MKVFHCSHCEHLVFFENTVCVRCQHRLAYLPDLETVGSLDPVGEDLWRCPINERYLYRLCENYNRENICNWAIPATDTHSLCRSCGFTLTVPALDQPGHKEAWYKLEVAKRRLLYSLWSLGCPVESKSDDPARGFGFQFLADMEGPDAAPVITGHADGIITINIAEADDAERERRRQQLHEPYRTLLGHFRHESGHYYWDRLIKNSPWINAFRETFGEERSAYGEALERYYQSGPSTQWSEHFVSAYASAHPWEDWAETWAHYLHMADTLEIAGACGLSLRPHRPDEPALAAAVNPARGDPMAFDELIKRWFSLTYVLNNLNRSLGQPDGYPFVLSNVVIDKLRLVHLAVKSTAAGKRLEVA
jgi:hypothetical protein